MIHVLLGTRAQVIKMVPIMHLMQRRGIEYNFIFMAQHRATVYEILDDFGLKHPDYILRDIGSDIVRSTQMAAWSLSVLVSGTKNRSKIFKGDKKGIVLLHGDAPPFFLGAILARIQGLRVAAVEAGLRSFNLRRPFPEELIRVLTARLGLIDIHFCQDTAAMKNASRHRGLAVHTKGNTIVDAIELGRRINHRKQPEISHPVQDKYAIVTLHRYETISRKAKLSQIVDLVLRVSHTINVKFILHPPTRAALHRERLYEKLAQAPRIELMPRMNFIDFQKLVAAAEFMITDGGSNQEESSYIGIPCLLFRSETERSEGLGHNVVLSAFDPKVIDDFVANYQRHRCKTTKTLTSPSQIIVDEVVVIAAQAYE